MKQCISYVQTSKKPMIQLGGSPCILFSLSLVCLAGRVRVGKHLSAIFPINKEMLHRHFFNFVLEPCFAIRFSSRNPKKVQNLLWNPYWYTISQIQN